ncbi:DUF2946 family protein [Marinibaculum pumilum]|uniref:DUF2946 family protein n=1 Tax=Marinibaculum pumilum TaxID=1766165 RepID=A0ABV7L0U5_9PROT
MRDILRDRLSGGALALLIAWFLVLQTLIGGIGAGIAHAGSAGGGFAVICSPSGLLAAGAGTDIPGGPAAPAHSCCLALCQALGGLPPALPASATLHVLPAPAGPGAFATASGLERPAGPAFRLPEARAPPAAA